MAAPMRLLPVMKIPLQAKRAPTRDEDGARTGGFRRSGDADRSSERGVGGELTRRRRGRRRRWRRLCRWRRRCRARSARARAPTTTNQTTSSLHHLRIPRRGGEAISLPLSLSLSPSRARRGAGRGWGWIDRRRRKGEIGEGKKTRVSGRERETRRDVVTRWHDEEMCVCVRFWFARDRDGAWGVWATRGCGCGPSDLLMDGSGLQVDWAHGIGNELDSKHRLGFFKKKLLYNTK